MSQIPFRSSITQKSPNTACTRRLGVCAFSGSLRSLRLVPSKWRYLVPPTSEYPCRVLTQTQTVGTPLEQQGNKMKNSIGLIVPKDLEMEQNTIKAASLFFDSVNIVLPITVETRGNVFKQYRDQFYALRDRLKDVLDSPPTESEISSETKKIIDFQHTVNPLIKEGVIKIVNPFYELSDKNLQAAFDVILDYRLKQHKGVKEDEMRQSRRKSQTFSSKSSKKTSKPKGTRNSTIRTTFAQDVKMVPSISHIIDAIAKGSLEESLREKDNRTWKQKLSDIVKPRFPLFRVETEFVDQILTDAAILMNREYEAIPISYERENLFKHLKDIKAIRSEGTYKILQDSVSLDIVEKSVVESSLSFDNVSPKDISRLRKYCQDELIAFRSHIRKLASTLLEDNLTNSDAIKILQLVNKEVVPEFTQMENRMKTSRSLWTKKFIKNAYSYGSLSILSAAYLAHIPLHSSLIAIGIVAGAQATMEKAIDEKKLRAENALSFLLRLK